MTRPYENEFEDAPVRLEGWIAEAEALAARSSEPETLQALNVELTRQAALREQYAACAAADKAAESSCAEPFLSLSQVWRCCSRWCLYPSIEKWC